MPIQYTSTPLKEDGPFGKKGEAEQYTLQVGQEGAMINQYMGVAPSIFQVVLPLP